MSENSAIAGAMQADEPGHAGDDELGELGLEPLGDERDLAVVVGEADAHEPLVGDALLVAELREVALVDGLGARAGRGSRR